MLRFVEAVRTLSPEQVAALAGLFGEEEGDTPARVLACLCSDRAPREAALDALGYTDGEERE